MSCRIIRLWLPKKVNGKLRWLVRVKEFTNKKPICIGGKYTVLVEKRYELMEGE